jgi:hypothetical protein
MIELECPFLDEVFADFLLTLRRYCTSLTVNDMPEITPTYTVK